MGFGTFIIILVADVSRGFASTGTSPEFQVIDFLDISLTTTLWVVGI